MKKDTDKYMKTGLQFKHYVWIVNTLRKYERLTLSELNQLWVREEVADGNPLPRSSFNNYRDASSTYGPRSISSVN